MEKKTSTPQPPKLSVTLSAEAVLNTALEKINEGFLGGKISKLDLASWSIMTALEDLTEAKIEKIRKPFFNELTYLETMVKLIRKNGQDNLTPQQFSTIQGLFGNKGEKSKTKAQKEQSQSQ